MTRKRWVGLSAIVESDGPLENVAEAVICYIPYPDGVWRAEGRANGLVFQAWYREQPNGDLVLLAVDPEVLPA